MVGHGLDDPIKILERDSVLRLAMLLLLWTREKNPCDMHMWTCPGSNRTPLASLMLSERDNQLHHMPSV